jgi:hypothetical protein
MFGQTNNYNRRSGSRGRYTNNVGFQESQGAWSPSGGRRRYTGNFNGRTTPRRTNGYTSPHRYSNRDFTVKELREQAWADGIRGYSKMNKAQLYQALNGWGNRRADGVTLPVPVPTGTAGAPVVSTQPPSQLQRANILRTVLPTNCTDAITNQELVSILPNHATNEAAPLRISSLHRPDLDRDIFSLIQFAVIPSGQNPGTYNLELISTRIPEELEYLNGKTIPASDFTSVLQELGHHLYDWFDLRDIYDIYAKRANCVAADPHYALRQVWTVMRARVNLIQEFAGQFPDASKSNIDDALEDQIAPVAEILMGSTKPFNDYLRQNKFSNIPGFFQQLQDRLNAELSK